MSCLLTQRSLHACNSSFDLSSRKIQDIASLALCGFRNARRTIASVLHACRIFFDTIFAARVSDEPTRAVVKVLAVHSSLTVQSASKPLCPLRRLPFLTAYCVYVPQPRQA